MACCVSMGINRMHIADGCYLRVQVTKIYAPKMKGKLVGCAFLNEVRDLSGRMCNAVGEGKVRSLLPFSSNVIARLDVTEG